ERHGSRVATEFSVPVLEVQKPTACCGGAGNVVCSLCFFFSSRRRHTRFSRDWSSDVCSSDLGRHLSHRRLPSGQRPACPGRADRSEERRVGKEWRSRRSPDHQKKKASLGGAGNVVINSRTLVARDEAGTTLAHYDTERTATGS